MNKEMRSWTRAVLMGLAVKNWLQEKSQKENLDGYLCLLSVGGSSYARQPHHGPAR